MNGLSWMQLSHELPKVALGMVVGRYIFSSSLISTLLDIEKL